MIRKYFREFIKCHDGITNRLSHLVGLGFVIAGILERSFWLVILGAAIQELGHAYQYVKTGDKKYSPLFCLKSQSIFVYPAFAAIIVYVLAA